MLPPLTLAFFTFTPSMDHPRHHYAVRCLGELLSNLGYEGVINLHIADDGSPKEHVETLLQVARNLPCLDRTSWTSSERQGYGASYNAMTNVVHDHDTDLVLCVEDDWALVRPFDVTELAKALGSGAGINSIRLNYLGMSAQRSMTGAIIRPIPGQTFFEMDAACPEFHLWSAGPRLEQVGFQRALGLFPEHCSAGEMEIEVCRRYVARRGICWPLDAGVNAALDNPSTFAHIGTVSVKDEPVV